MGGVSGGGLFERGRLSGLITTHNAFDITDPPGTEGFFSVKSNIPNTKLNTVCSITFLL